MQETGKAANEIDRATLWKRARVRKSGGYDENVKEVVDKIVSFFLALPASFMCYKAMI